MSKTDNVQDTTPKELETSPLDDSMVKNDAPADDDSEQDESTVPQASAKRASDDISSTEISGEEISKENAGDVPQEEEKEAEAKAPAIGNAGQEAYSTEAISENDTDDDNPHVNIGSVRLQEQLVVTEQKTGTRFTFLSDGITEITIGRRSTTIPEVLQIDLGDIIEPTDGISRTHASIVRQDGLLFIVDRDSRNGTYLNGQKLVPEQLRIIRDSDLIRLGRVVLSISYETVPTDNA